MTALLKYDEACRAIAEAKSFDEVKEWADKAAAVREYARRAKNRALEIDAAEIRIRADRRRGELIVEMKAEGVLREGRPKKQSSELTVSELRLEDLETSKYESTQAQKLAAYDGGSFERLMARWRAHQEGEAKRVTLNIMGDDKKAQAKAEHAARVHDGCDIDDLHDLVAEGRKFKSILIDPPWKFVTRSPKGEGRSAGEHYTTTGLDQIKALPVTELADEDCVMFMWMVDWAPKWAFDLIEHWGFEHKTTAFTWAKQNESGEGWHMGQGYWTRANPEDCWLATRGNPERIYADVRQLIVAPVMEHSRKPDEIHDRIKRLVAGPYLELYARRPREGWVTWGNEISREEFRAQPETPHDPATGELIEDDGLELPACLRRTPQPQETQA